MKFSGIFEFRVRNPDELLGAEEIENILKGRVNPEQDQSWFLADDRVPVAEFDVNNLLELYDYFAAENGNSLPGGIQGGGLKEGDVIVMSARLVKRDQEGKLHYQDVERRHLMILSRSKLKTMKAKYPKLSVSARTNTLNGLVVLPKYNN